MGIGTGSIFNPALIAMKLHPASGSATGMYLTIYTTCSAALIMLIFGILNLEYCLALNLIVVLATFPGLYLQIWCVKKTGRAWITVVIL